MLRKTACFITILVGLVCAAIIYFDRSPITVAEVNRGTGYELPEDSEILVDEIHDVRRLSRVRWLLLRVPRKCENLGTPMESGSSRLCLNMVHDHTNLRFDPVESEVRSYQHPNPKLTFLGATEIATKQGLLLVIVYDEAR